MFAILLSQDYEDKYFCIEYWKIEIGSSEKYKEEVEKYNASSAFKHASIYFAMSEYDLECQRHDLYLMMNEKKGWRFFPACSLGSPIFGDESKGVLVN